MLPKKGEMLNEKQIVFIFLTFDFFSLALFIISSPLKKKKSLRLFFKLHIVLSSGFTFEVRLLILKEMHRILYTFIF